MDLQLQGRRALVTGSSGGIGAQVARRLAAEGCSVVVHGRNRERSEAVAAEIGAAGVAIGDLSTDAGAEAVYREARAALGAGVEILVNNAGGGNGTDSNTRGPLAVTTAEWVASYQHNTLSAVRMILHAVPEMRAAGWGRVIQVSSAVAVQPIATGPDYAAAKAAMNNLTVSLAGSLRGCGITVNTVSPGVVAVPDMVVWGREMFGDKPGWGGLDDEALKAKLALDVFNIPAGRLGVVDDSAVVVCLLASPLSGYVTGADYRVDGGLIRTVN
jgi:NAD(P)-dependent dehydrogenase (short-subunit alcohol dehydrogenase family)